MAQKSDLKKCTFTMQLKNWLSWFPSNNTQKIEFLAPKMLPKRKDCPDNFTSLNTVDFCTRSGPYQRKAFGPFVPGPWTVAKNLFVLVKKTYVSEPSVRRRFLMIFELIFVADDQIYRDHQFLTIQFLTHNISQFDSNIYLVFQRMTYFDSCTIFLKYFF